MTRPSTRSVAAAFLVSFLAVGLPYWAVPYSRANLPNTLMTPGLIVVGVTALLLRSLRIASLKRSALVIGSSVPGAVMARVVVEALRDPTSHNLWPFELVIALFLGLPLAFVGGMVGAGIARLRTPGSQRNQP